MIILMLALGAIIALLVLLMFITDFIWTIRIVCGSFVVLLIFVFLFIAMIVT